MFIGLEILPYIEKLNGHRKVFGVKDDVTFYHLLKEYKSELDTIRVNFYDLKCIGFKHKDCIFKQKGVQYISELLKYEEKYTYTYGAYSLKLLKQLICEQKIIATHINPELRKHIRKAYVGGRNEFISDPILNNKLYSVDFNTMYLSCLHTKFLTGQLSYKPTSVLSEPGFYYIKYTDTTSVYPVLYTKNNLTGQAYFCNGVGEGLFWHEEIDGITGVYKAENYTENFKPFVKKIEELGDKKVKKLLANNLYGRLAMKDYIYTVKLATDLDFYLLEKMGLIKCGSKWYDFFIYESLEHTTYNDYTDIAAAAAITSKARIKLYHLLKDLQNHMQICLLNTDEIIVSGRCAPTLGPEGDVKIKEISYEQFSLKKHMFENKRFAQANGMTRAYKNINGMRL